jgi:hypothetical protein
MALSMKLTDVKRLFDRQHDTNTSPVRERVNLCGFPFLFYISLTVSFFKRLRRGKKVVFVCDFARLKNHARNSFADCLTRIGSKLWGNSSITNGRCEKAELTMSLPPK